MTNDFRMSYFMPPIAPIKDEHGQLVTPPTLIPCSEVSVEQVFQMITCNENLKVLTEQVRNSEDIRDSLWYILASQQQMPHRSFPPNSSRYRLSHLLSGSSGDA